MVKMFALLRRREGMSTEEFRAHWRDVHGPLIRDTPELARHIVRYEQHPRHRPDALSGTAGVDGVAVQWFRSIDDFLAFISEPGYQELIAPDERRFLDTDSIEFLITEEPNVVIAGPEGLGSGGTQGGAS
ncbi:EthD domain-containing protein [Dermatobacter hominis]|uniref:EthD domain-containing protein n=1 Tax=Dermatobacter hominis TaxID=2884263 RepID=UPI001D11CC95|nr:EthD domain-containing protein [Dermatobacter hominis]UDY37825.1 EthD domain-containing protein [Dermatobacter hominis]